MSPGNKRQLVRSLAHSAGFDLAGVTPAHPRPGIGYYRDWLSAGHAAEMTYLERNVHIRANPAELLPGARTIISLAVNYRRNDGYIRPGEEPLPQPGPDPLPPTGLIAQYARGDDYHAVLRRMAEELVVGLRDRLRDPFGHRVCVDTAPVLERELAAAAGLGWLGKNTCLLNRRLGSYLLLAEILTTLEIESDTPAEAKCGSCRRCVDACPTGAIVAPGRLDSRRCIAYLTIEHRGAIAAEYHPAMGDHVFGCDICQQVCPYNARAPLGAHPRIMAERLPARVDLLALTGLRSADCRRLVDRTAARRARPAMWRRNAVIALGNCGPPVVEVIGALNRALEDEHPAVKQAATVSLERLGAGGDAE
jgi:epoxyqueuosine reductase